jgi:PAS domain S-box-containing protein
LGQNQLIVVSDLAVWLACLAIPCVLGFLVLRRRDVSFRSIVWLLAAFILVSGTAHLMEAVIAWWPAYRLAGLIKLITAVVSWATVIALVPLVHQAPALRKPEELEQEIADLRRAEPGFRESEERFRQLTENIHQVFWMQEGGWERTLYVSPAYEQVWGRTCQSLYEQPRSWLDNVHPDDRELVLAQLEKQLRGTATDTEFSVVRENGSLRRVRCRAFPIKDHAGEVYRVAGLAEDITDHKRAEEALRESEERFRGTFENAAVGIAHMDNKNRCLRANERLCEILGYPSFELVGKTLQEVVHPDDLEPNLALFDLLVRDELPNFSMEKRFIRKDGAVVWTNVTASVKNGSAGQPAYCIAIVQDISDRKGLEDALREGEHRWRSLTEALPQLVWSAMPDGACDYFSRQWTQHTGVPEADLLGWRWLDVLHPDDREPTRRFWTNSVAGRGAYDVEYRVRRSDGVYRWFKTRGVPIRDSAGNIDKWFGTCTDITDVKQAEVCHLNYRSSNELYVEPLAA